MLPVIEAIRPLHPSKTWDDISPQFLTTFWSLTMFDLFVPDNVYSKELARLKAAPAKVDENKVLAIVVYGYGARNNLRFADRS
jgi:THO complex subunit 2